MKKILLMLAMVALVLTSFGQTRVIAHRGLWTPSGSAQNSITSLRLAAESGCYGSEFDVQLSRDGVVVVNHDEATDDGTVISMHDWSDLQGKTLKNGEQLSLLSAYLDEGKKHPGTQLILEIKAQPTPEAEDQITAAAVNLVNERGMGRQVEYISFSWRVCCRLRQLLPQAAVYYLNSDKTPMEVAQAGLTGIDYDYNVVFKHPEWVEQAHRLGMKVNVWTVDKRDDLKHAIDLGVDFITTNQPQAAMDMIGGK